MLAAGSRPAGPVDFDLPDRALFFQHTPAFDLHSLQKTGQDLSGVDGTGPLTGNRQHRSTSAGRAAARGEATARLAAIRQRTRAQLEVHTRERAGLAAGPNAKRCPPRGARAAR